MHCPNLHKSLLLVIIGSPFYRLRKCERLCTQQNPQPASCTSPLACRMLMCFMVRCPPCAVMIDTRAGTGAGAREWARQPLGKNELGSVSGRGPAAAFHCPKVQDTYARTLFNVLSCATAIERCAELVHCGGRSGRNRINTQAPSRIRLQSPQRATVA
jgi:hypothetical protein